MIPSSGMILALIMGAMIFSQFMAISGLPGVLALAIYGLPLPPIGVVVVILLALIAVGCVMSPILVILIT